MNILIVEDNPTIALSIKKTLQKCNVVNCIEIALNYSEALNKISNNCFDVFLIDIGLGVDSLSGFDLCKFIRERDTRTPIIIITGSYSLEYLETAFDLGVNDYITKPFNTKELEIRVKRWIALSQDVVLKEEIVYNDLSYKVQTNEFYYQGEPLPLSKKNKILLLMFVKNSEQLLTKSHIEKNFWGDYDCLESRRNVRSNIQRLRGQLGPSCGNWVRTIRGEGYMLKK